MSASRSEPGSSSVAAYIVKSKSSVIQKSSSLTLGYNSCSKVSSSVSSALAQRLVCYPQPLHVTMDYHTEWIEMVLAMDGLKM